MNELPTEMIDRWENRVDQAPGEGRIYWHILLGDNPDVVALAKEAQQRLAPFTGLHLTPLRWLHMTLLVAGSASDIDGQQIQQMASAAGRMLATTPPITVTVGKVLYHPEAIMLAAQPVEALVPVLEAARAATREVTGTPGRPGNQLPWAPHITIAYSTMQQPAEPTIAALGKSLSPRRVRLTQVTLVNQRGPERDWDWNPQATVCLETTP